MRKLLLFSLLFFLLTNCKKEKLGTELSFLEGEWKMKFKFVQYLEPGVNYGMDSVEQNIVMKFGANGELSYSDEKNTLLFRIVNHELSYNEQVNFTFFNIKYQVQCIFTVKDKKNKRYYIKFYFQKDLNNSTEILGMYFKPSQPISATNRDVYQIGKSIKNKNEYYAFNPWAGVFIKK